MKCAVTLALLAALSTLSSCRVIFGARDVPMLARSTVATDYATYPIQRVGLMPAVGGGEDRAMTIALEEGLVSEMTRTTPFEVVRLGSVELEEVRDSHPYRNGHYDLDTIIDVARRYRLDAVAFPTVVQQRFFTPIVLAVQMDLVAAETGLVIWSGSVHLDGQDAAVREGLEIYFSREDGSVGGQDWSVALLSPSRYARFAAYQLARLM